ncbi:MAG: NBR1-Ig-like domain-containing protein, partial [Chloroflexota bacterium]
MRLWLMPPRIMRTVALAGTLLLSGVQHAHAYDWPQFNGDSQHSGNNTQETLIDRSTVGGLHKVFATSLPDIADGAPAALDSVATPSVTRDLLFITTKLGYIVAVDAHSGAVVWQRQFVAPGCLIASSSTPCYTTSSPVTDPNRQYVYTYGLDGYVHKLQVGDGTEITGNGWPELATTKGNVEKGSSALSIATAQNGTSYLYVANGGYPGDAGDYQGHLTTISLATGTQHVFNSLCSDQPDVHFTLTSPDCAAPQSAVWGRPGVAYDRAADMIYIATGNGLFNGTNEWGDSVLKLFPNGTEFANAPLDSYTPTNYASLQQQDLDLGSTTPVILPVPNSSAVQHLGLQVGKDSMLRLLNLDNLSGQGGPGHTGGEVGTIVRTPQGGEVLAQPAVWVNPHDNSTWVIVSSSGGISGLKLVFDGSGNPSLVSQWLTYQPGASPLIANGIVFYAAGNLIQALDPTTGAVLWRDTDIGGIHWQSPIVVNGMLYILDNNQTLTAYGVAAASYAPSGQPGTFLPGQTVTYQATLTNTGTTTWSAGGPTPFHLRIAFAAPGGTAIPESNLYTDQGFALPADVVPGQSVTVTVAVTAPPAPGSYILIYQMVQEGVAFFPQYFDSNVTVASNQPANSASYVISGQPGTFTASQNSTYQVTLTNTGTATWSAGGSTPYHLRVAFAAAGGTSVPRSTLYTDQGYALPADVAAGQSATLSITVTPPASPGNDTLIYQMVQEGIAFFPQYMDSSTTVVSPQAPYSVSYAPSGQPGAFIANQPATYQVTLTNTGSSTWSAGGPNPVHLRIAFAAAGSTAIPGSTLYTDQGFALPADIAPGQSTTLAVRVSPPAGAGSYTLIYQMVQEGV